MARDMRHCRAAGIAGAALSLISSPAVAQPRTIRVLVPFPPGGSADILARLLGDQVGKAQGVTILTENRPGAGATIAYEATARAAPDGNTVVISANSLVINPILRKVNYDPLTSFEPVCYLLSSPQVVVVNSTSPYKTSAIFSPPRAPSRASSRLRASARPPPSTSASSSSSTRRTSTSPTSRTQAARPRSTRCSAGM